MVLVLAVRVAFSCAVPSIVTAPVGMSLAGTIVKLNAPVAGEAPSSPPSANEKLKSAPAASEPS